MGSPLLERSRELGEGAMVTDDNAADARAGAREPGLARRKDLRCSRAIWVAGMRAVLWGGEER